MRIIDDENYKLDTFTVNNFIDFVTFKWQFAYLIFFDLQSNNDRVWYSRLQTNKRSALWERKKKAFNWIGKTAKLDH